jgi:TonB-linked SusC/RagA family outer membrane protein
MKNKFLNVWFFLLAFAITATAQNEPDKGQPEVADVFEELEEVVVTAGGITREKKALGFAVEEVEGASIKESGETNIISGISAKVSGVQVTNSSGAAGAASYIKIRGNATFTSNDNQPLMVVDGVPIDNSQIRTEDLRAGVSYSNRAIDINPDDIESVSVLKGGAAAALYGTRGANGVILITTKKGSYGQDFQVNVNSSMEISQVNKLPPLQTKYSQGYFGSYEGGTGNPWSFGPALSELGYDADGNITQNATGGVTPYDHYSFFQRGRRLNNSVTLSGGGKTTSYYLSLSNLQDEGIVPLNRFDRTTVRMTGTGQISTNLKMTSSIAYSSSGGYRVQQGSNTSGLMLGLLRTPPSFDNSNGADDPTDPSAYLNADGSQRNYRAGGGYDNPYWTINQNPFTDDVNRVFGYTKLDWSPLEGMLVSYRYGLDQYSDVRKQIIAKNSRTFPGGSITDEAWNVKEINQDLTVNYTTKFGPVGANLLAGFNANQRDYKYVGTYGTGLVLPDFYNMSNAQNQQAYESITGRRIWGAYAEAQLDYADWAYLTLTARRDQASTFGDVSTPILYPSASLALILTEVLDIQSDVLNFAKLRVSSAKVGSEPPFASNATYFNQAEVTSGWINGISFPYLGITGFTQSDILGNPDLRAEYTITNEVGAEFRLFDNKVNADITVYKQTSEDLIVAVPVAASSGFTSSYTNAGTMTNTGVELQFNTNLVESNDFTLNAGMTFTRNRNKVVELAPGVDVIGLPWGFFGANQRLVAGEAYGTLYGDDWLRDENGNALVGANGYPIYSSTEVVVGDPNPDYLMGITTNASYKNWTFNMLWDIRQGGDIWNGTRGALYYFGTHADTDIMPDGTERGEYFVWEDVVMGNSGFYAPGTLDADGNDIGGQPNTTEIVNDFDSYYYGGLSGFTGASRPFIEDGSWVRLRNVSLNYRFDKDAIKSTKLKGLSVGVTGRNLFLSTPYRGVDPETNLSGATNSQGADYFNMPNTMGVIFNVKANL